MQLCSAIVNARPVLLCKHEGGLRNLTATRDPQLASMQTFLDAGQQGIEKAADGAAGAPAVAPADFEFLPVVPRPSKILCVGRNYAQHAIEQGAEVPGEPLIFAKAPSSLTAHQHAVHLPSQSDRVDYEAELVVVIGRRARNVTSGRGLEYVAGYTCGNDVTARDWQRGKPGKQWLLGKSFDTFAPIGPCLVTSDEIPDPHGLSIQMSINGTVVQSAHTNQMMFTVEFLVVYLSRIMTLEAGDLLFTGTPAGVGFAQSPPQFLQSGDEMVVEISSIGRLENVAQRVY